MKRNDGLFDVTMVSMIERKFINLQVPFDFCPFLQNIEKTLLVSRGMMAEPCLKNTSDTESENVPRK